MIKGFLQEFFGFSHKSVSPILKATLLLFISIAGNLLA